LAALTTPAVRRPPPLGSLFGSDITTAGPRPEYKVQPAAIQALYRDYVIPLTKDVEVRAPQRGGGHGLGNRREAPSVSRCQGHRFSSSTGSAGPPEPGGLAPTDGPDATVFPFSQSP